MDCKTATFISPRYEDLLQKAEAKRKDYPTKTLWEVAEAIVEEELTKLAKKTVETYFNLAIANLLEAQPPEKYQTPPETKMPRPACIPLGTVGVEYADLPLSEHYPDARWWIVWHHYRDDCHEETGVETLGS